jgi:ADP-ribose pyrophosphatase
MIMRQNPKMVLNRRNGTIIDVDFVVTRGRNTTLETRIARFNDLVEPVTPSYREKRIYDISGDKAVDKESMERFVSVLDKYVKYGATPEQIFDIIDRVAYNMRTTNLDTLGSANSRTFTGMLDALETHLKERELTQTPIDSERLSEEIHEGSGRFAYRFEYTRSQEVNNAVAAHHNSVQERNAMLMANGTEVLKDKPGYERGPANWLVDVTFDAPNGPVKREVVVRDSGTLTIPIDHDGKIVFVIQYREPTGKYSPELPGGGIKAGETPNDAGQRELKEELGYRMVGNAKYEFFGEPTPYMSTEVHYHFSRKVEKVEDAKQKLDNTEIIAGKAVALTIEEALQAIRDGVITHEPTIAAVGVYAATQFQERLRAIERS